MKESLREAADATKILKYSSELMQKELADKLQTSRQNISHMKNGRRRMQQDIAKNAFGKFENNLINLSISHEFTEILPDVFDGPALNQSLLSYLVMYQKEAREFNECIDQVTRIFIKNPEGLTSQERQTSIDSLMELIDVLAWGYNLLFFAGNYLKTDVLQLIKEKDSEWKASNFI